MKTFIKKIIHTFFPIKNIIIFESVPTMSGNTKAVFDEMLQRGLNKKYKLVWFVEKEEIDFPKIKNVKYINPERNRLSWIFYATQARAFVCENRFLEGNKKCQLSFYLSHGLPIKSIKKHYTIPSFVDYCFTTGEKTIDLMASEFNYPKEKMVALGYPRNDELLRNKIDVGSLFGANYKKVVAWYPTFRQHKNGRKAATNTFPIIHTAEQARMLNECAKDNDMLIVLKPHFAQNLDYIKDLSLSNIRFIDDSFFKDNRISSYQFVGSCDALITDYSSIYYDFLLCDKPIAAIWEDIEEYKESTGLIDDYEFYMKGAEKIYTIQDMEEFILRLAKGKD